MKPPEHYFSKGVIGMLKRQHYSLFGHSAVKICHWTKESLRRLQKDGEESDKERGVCYKQKFYGIESHRCLQMTPCTNWCQQQCVFCWRPLAETGTEMKEYDEPEEIIEESIKSQRVLLSGFGALKEKIGSKKLEEAMNPNQVAISLSGEPTTYPLLPELVEGYRKKCFSTFVVTNGMHPEMMARLKPTQIYMSLEAPDIKTHKKINAPLIRDSWERLDESLGIFSGLKGRKVIRVTAVKGWNMHSPEGLARLIEKANPDFVEVKAYMFVGYSRERMKEDNMPSHDEVKDFAEKINNNLNYTLAGESKASRVVLLSRGSKPLKIGKE